MRNLRVNLLELIRRTSAELPDDVFRVVDVGTKAEEAGTTGGYAMDIITKNIDLARRKSQPLCQDTGSILFFVKAPWGSTRWASKSLPRRPWPRRRPRDTFARTRWIPSPGETAGTTSARGARAALPPASRGAARRAADPEGRRVRERGRAVFAPRHHNRGQPGPGRSPEGHPERRGGGPGERMQSGDPGCLHRGDRATGYLHSKEQLLRTLEDVHPDPGLAALEQDIVKSANTLGIGPMGFGGKTTLLGCKIGSLNRLPASFFVSVSYMCWAYRRQGSC